MKRQCQPTIVALQADDFPYHVILQDLLLELEHFRQIWRLMEKFLACPIPYGWASGRKKKIECCSEIHVDWFPTNIISLRYYNTVMFSP
jgi:hypothetical protein